MLSASRELWSWLCLKVSSRHVQKKWLRATIVVIVMLILVVVPSTTRDIGQADIFAATLSVALPPFLPISVHIYVMCSLLFCLLVSWGWLCVATAAAWAARSPTLLVKQMQSAQASYIRGIPIAAQTWALTFSGHFLDPRSSTVFGVFVFFGSLFFALGLGYWPEMAVVLYFALTFMDAIFSVNPLLPEPSYSRAHAFVVAAAVYAAVSLASQIVIFPESYSHSWLQQVREDVLLPIIEFMEHDKPVAIKKPLPGPLSRLDPILAMYERMKNVFHLEFSIHRLSPDELVSLFALIKQLLRRAKNIEASQNRIGEALQFDNDPSDEKATDRERFTNLSDGLRIACRVSLLDVEEWVRECTMDTWFDVINAVDTKKVDYRRLRLDISRSNLRKAQTKVKRDDLPNFFKYTDRTSGSNTPQINESQVSSVRRNQEGATLLLALLDDIDLLATELITLLSYLIDIEENQPKPKPRLPSLFARTKKIQSTNSLREEGNDISLPTSPNRKQLQSSAVQPNLTSIPRRDSRPLHWILAPETIYAVRMAILSVALFAINVSKTTLRTYMLNSGVVALLLGQSYVAIYAGDQVFFFVVRFAATVLGLLLTLAGWYIGAGRGSGNLYTVVLVTGILVIPSLLVSVCATKMSHILFAVLASTTIIASTGFIWSQTHGPGIVFSSEIVFKNIWTRALLDLIGFAASAVVMMIPMPVTARRGFHDKLSKSLLQVGGMIYSGMDELASFASERDDILRSITKKQNMLMHFLTSMNFDPRIRSYPSATHRRILELHTRIVSSTMQYMESRDRLDTTLRRGLACKMPSLNNDIIDRVQSHMVQLSGNIAGGSRSPKLVNLGEELCQLTPTKCTEFKKLGSGSRGYELLALPEDIPEKQLLILSSIVVNFASIVNSMDEMKLLFEGMEPQPEPRNDASCFRSQNA